MWGHPSPALHPPILHYSGWLHFITTNWFCNNYCVLTVVLSITQQCYFTSKQECIPVGCVPSAVVAVSGWGEGVSAKGAVYLREGGVCLRQGVCLPDNPPPWTEWQTGVKTLPCVTTLRTVINESDSNDNIKFYCVDKETKFQNKSHSKAVPLPH